MQIFFQDYFGSSLWQALVRPNRPHHHSCWFGYTFQWTIFNTHSCSPFSAIINTSTTALTKVMTTSLRNIMASTNLECRSSVTYCFNEHSCQGRTKKSSNALEDQIFRQLYTKWWERTPLLPFLSINTFFLFMVMVLVMISPWFSITCPAVMMPKAAGRRLRPRTETSSGEVAAIHAWVFFWWLWWIETDSDGLKLIQMDWNRFRWIETRSDGLKDNLMDWRRIRSIETDSDGS